MDAPSTWKKNDEQCGTPIADTVIVMYAGEATPDCALARPPTNISVIELRSGSSAGLGTAGWQPGTIDGVAVEETNRRTDDGRHERLVSFQDRNVTVDMTSPDQSVIDTATRSLQVTDTDPSTGCAVHTDAYDDGQPTPQGDHHNLLPGHPSSATGCVYVSGWLEQSAVVTGNKLTSLVDAIKAAPETTDRRAPDDTNCESVADSVTADQKAPMVLHFGYADTSTWTLVAKISWCTRWQSTISSGDVTRRIDRQLLLALPQLWTSYPDPDSMDIG